MMLIFIFKHFCCFWLFLLLFSLSREIMIWLNPHVFQICGVNCPFKLWVLATWQAVQSFLNTKRSIKYFNMKSVVVNWKAKNDVYSHTDLFYPFPLLSAEIQVSEVRRSKRDMSSWLDLQHRKKEKYWPFTPKNAPSSCCFFLLLLHQNVMYCVIMNRVCDMWFYPPWHISLKGQSQ